MVHTNIFDSHHNHYVVLILSLNFAVIWAAFWVERIFSLDILISFKIHIISISIICRLGMMRKSPPEANTTSEQANLLCTLPRTTLLSKPQTAPRTDYHPVPTAPMDSQIYMGPPSMQVTVNPYSTTTGNLRSKSESQKWRKPFIEKNGVYVHLFHALRALWFLEKTEWGKNMCLWDCTNLRGIPPLGCRQVKIRVSGNHASGNCVMRGLSVHPFVF